MKYIPNSSFIWNLPSIVDSRIIHENIIEKDRVQRVTQEIFGDSPQPRLEFAQYKVGHCYKLSTVINIFLRKQNI